MTFRSLLVLPFVFTALTAQAADKVSQTKPAAIKPAPAQVEEPPTPRVAAPAFVDTVTFKVESDGEKREMTVVSAPGLIRVDVPTDRMSVIYDPQSEHYTGLEHSNYTWWEFTWPEVRDAVQGSTRYAARLRDLGPELMEENNDGSSSSTTTGSNASPPGSVTTSETTSSALSMDTNAPTTDSAAAMTAGSDNSGYVWHPTTDKKIIADLECVHWIGETVGGEQIDAWCTTGPQPAVSQSVSILRAMNEPMALVPVRNLMPPLFFVAWDALTKGGVTPVLMTWGAKEDPGRVALVNVKQREGKLSYFEVPKIYVKTTLVTMDGIGNQKPPSEPRHGGETAPLKLPPPVLPTY